ncbi:MAG TPA: glycoside hydrolase domain-containing protein [Planctomycetota bacterium]|jgi:hypothetical protein
MNRALGICVLLMCVNALGTDVAFWTEYKTDADTYLLMPCTDLKTGEGKIASIDTVGEPTLDPQGKFGSALKLNGRSGLKVMPSEIFPGGFLSIEAWIKLDKLPAKNGYIVFRPAEVDKNPQYDPTHDVTKGFALFVDSAGALHLETTNCFYGSTTRTSSQPGAIVPGKWLHVAGISAQFPDSHRRLYVDGKELVCAGINWGQGLTVSGDEEKKPGPLFVGNNDKGDSGIEGLIDQLRIHRNVFQFQPPDAPERFKAAPAAPLAQGAPHFAPEHLPGVYLALDGNADLTIDKVPGVKAKSTGTFIPAGVRGGALQGRLTLDAPQLGSLDKGSIEFWGQPVGFNSCSDRNIGFITTNAFTLYLFNSQRPEGSPLSLYFSKGKDAGLHFVTDQTGTLYFPGRWYHIVVTWKGKDIAFYVNGKEAARGYGESLQRPGDTKGLLTQINFFPGGNGLIDEVYVYPEPLMPEEVANAYARYTDPAQLSDKVRLRPVEVRGQYLPTYNKIYYILDNHVAPDRIASVKLALKNAQGKTLCEDQTPFTREERSLTVPALEDGSYTLTTTATMADGSQVPGGGFPFVRKRFVWENNKIGVTDEMFPPFTPISVNGKTISVVQRSYDLSGFGLFEKVVTKGRDILAGPMVMRCIAADHEVKWAAGKGRNIFTEILPHRATFKAEAISSAVNVSTMSTIEVDGCMKVEMQLSPGDRPAEIQKLWIEIPLKDSEAPLMHAIADGLRQNHSGFTPKGEGVVWDGSKAVHSPLWRNSFVPYIWLGAEERGLAWFAENDKGWCTEKNKSKTPIQELSRAGGVLTLKIYLINTPTTLKEARTLVFGLQATPTKPMPADFRQRLPYCPGGLAVVPWGGLQCASQGPFKDDWRIVDKILECREGKPFDEAWFKSYAAEHKPPPVHGSWDWLNSVSHFAGNAKSAGLTKPIAVYQEEMYAATPRPEWVVFQDEWGGEADGFARQTPQGASMDTGYAFVGGNAGVTFGASYRDFGTYFANEWMKRGVSIYWDNVYLKLSSNRRTTDAYICEDGNIQPALLIWAQREYQRRVWTALQLNRRVRKEPLEWVLHMTNTVVAPVHGWGTVDLDHELGNDKPFAPDWLRTETTGLQLGNMPLSLYAVTGNSNKVFAKLRETKPKAVVDRLVERTEWAMRLVHEIQRGRDIKEEKLIWDFGYATDAVTVHNYWAESPLLSVSNDSVKWLALSKPATKEILIVLASWSDQDAETEIKLLPKAAAFSTDALKLTDAESGEALGAANAAVKVKLPGPYGVRVLRVAP